MDKSVPGFINGHAISPKLTPEQQEIVKNKLAEGATIQATADAAKCTTGRVRQFKAATENAKAIKDLQTTTSMVRLIKEMSEHMSSLVDAMADLDSRIKNTNGELRKISKAVSYQKLNLAKAKTEIRDLKAERRRIRAFITAKGLDPDLA